MNAKQIRVLLAKSEFDGHERAMRYISQVLTEAGMKVVICRYHIVDDAATAVLQENVDVVGLQSYSPGLMHDVPRLMELLRQRGVENKLIIAGGTIPASEVPKLKQIGVAETFGPGTPVDKITEFIRANVKR